MTLIDYKVMAALVIFVISMAIAIYPLKKKRTLQQLESLALGEALASGIFLGAAFFHMLPDAILWTGTVSVRMKRIETDAAEDGQPFLRGSHRQPKPRRTHQCAQTCNCAVLEKPSAIDSGIL